MYQFLHLRSRLLQSLLLGLLALSFYAYYRTTTNEVHQFAVISNPSRRMFQEGLDSSSSNNSNNNNNNVTTETQSSALMKNLSIEASNNFSNNVSHNANLSTIITTFSTSSSSSSLLSSSSQTSSSASISINFKQNNENLKQFIKTGGNGTVSISPISVKNDSARAIYEFGHSVAIPDKCPNNGKDMELVIIVMSALMHIEARTAIRQTWGHFGQRRDISVLFMLGRSVDSKVEKILEREQKIYGDMIRGKFIDSYSNLTLKTISTLEWVDTYCSHVKFVLKTDDDMFINVPRLLSFINKHSRDKNVIFGRLAKKWKPIRNKKSKYYVSQAQYKQAAFPDFTTGPAYLLSRDVINKLYNAGLDQTYLKLEDVFMTGIVAHKLGIKRSHANEFLNKKILYNPCNIQRGISIHMVKYSEQFDLWKKLLDGKTKCK